MEIRRSYDRLISTMGFPILERWHLYIRPQMWFSIKQSNIGRILNSLKPRRNEQHFADDIFKRIFFNENAWISIKFSLKYVRKGPIDINPALVQIMAWRRSGLPFVCLCCGLVPWPWFNIKMLSYQYRISHCGYKTILRSSYLHNGISYTRKITSLYWIRPQSMK